MYASCGSVCCDHICSIFSSFCVINSLPGWYFGHRYPVPKCMTEWIPWQLVGDRRDLIDHEKPCAVRETHILRRCRHDLNNWEAMQLCKGCRIRTCTLAKTKLLLLFLSKEKGVKVAELWRCRFWMSRTGMNCMAWLCMLLFLGSMCCCWDLVHTAQDQIPGSKEEKTRKLICSFHSFVPSACSYDSRLSLLILHDRIQCAAIWYDAIL